LKIIGVLLIVFGIFALVIGAIRYIDRDKVVDLGPLEVTTEEHKNIPLSPIVGLGALAGGVVLVMAGSRNRV
jgi:uncharacterized membrane protein YidH (DUF202 family)